ncbi:MAG: YfiR family protein [Limisphaerales bacterium]
MRALLLLLALVLGGLPGGPAFGARGQEAAEVFSPDELRAALLSKLPPYINWPDAPAGTPLVIGVLGGPNPSARLLEQLLRDVQVRQRPVEVRYFAEGAGIEEAHLLYVPAGREAEFAALPPERLRGMVTVGEDPGFLRQGGLINLRPDTAGAKISLQISLKNARSQGVRISTPLLRIAEVVDR